MTSNAAWSLKTHMRKLWADHVIWTREYLVAAIAATQDAQTAAGRLLKNQEHLGNAIWRHQYPPHFYVGRRRILRYKGRIDDARDPAKATYSDLEHALEDVLAHRGR
jgi:hypothetical protein